MKIKNVRLINYRSFVDSQTVHLGQLTVLIGANNSGKSSILRGLHSLQLGIEKQWQDVRVGASEAVIEMVLDGRHPKIPVFPAEVDVMYSAKFTNTDRRAANGSYAATLKLFNDSMDGVPALNGELRLPNYEPDHFIIPILSNRKTASFSEDTRESQVHAIGHDMSNLAAKLIRLGNTQYPHHAAYHNACKEILGSIITHIPSPSGHLPGIYLPDGSTLPISQMGEGVPNIVHLLVNLAVSKDKLFLIEEPENDLHPTALKALLNLIIKSSEHNQFVISTHSNIVVSHLCAERESKLYKVSCVNDKLPTEAKIELVPNNPQSRVTVLQELGYSFADFDLWEGWLLLEESSAERLIRDFLIPWFAPKLSRVRTVAAEGVDDVKVKFGSIERIVLFTHLQPAYAGRIWVRVDNDKAGKDALQSLRDNYKRIPTDRFASFPQPQFEHFYPAIFKDRIDAALAIDGKQERRTAKRELLNEVIAWLDEDAERGKTALKESAAEVIADLLKIQEQLLASLVVPL